MGSVRLNFLFVAAGFVVAIVIGAAVASTCGTLAAKPTFGLSPVKKSKDGDPPGFVQVRRESAPGSSVSVQQRPDEPKTRLLRAFASVAERSGPEVISTVREQLRRDGEVDPKLSAHARRTFHGCSSDRSTQVSVLEEICGAGGCLFIFAIKTTQQRGKPDVYSCPEWPGQTLQVLPFEAAGAQHGAVVLVVPEANL